MRTAFPLRRTATINYLVELLREESSECHSFKFIPQLVNPQAVRKRAVDQQSVSGELHRRHRMYHRIDTTSLIDKLISHSNSLHNGLCCRTVLNFDMYPVIGIRLETRGS